MPLTMPEPRYFSIPSSVVGGAERRKAALNWRPWTRSLTQVPLAWTNSPAVIAAAAPTRVTRSRWPRALTRRTQKPFSGLGKGARLAGGLDAQDAEAVLGVVEGDPLDQSRQRLALGGLGRARAAALGGGAAANVARTLPARAAVCGPVGLSRGGEDHHAGQRWPSPARGATRRGIAA